jgi:hypothetical protein
MMAREFELIDNPHLMAQVISLWPTKQARPSPVRLISSASRATETFLLR